MATSTKSTFYILLFLLLSSSSNAHSLKACNFDAIYNLGASKSDTGNSIRENPNGSCSRLPYGETFFKNVTGRCSDGLLIIDYIALDAGLPLLNPYLNKAALTNHGVNFAVAGSTALPCEVLLQMNILSVPTNSSLKVQLDWMFSHLNPICYNEIECNKKVGDALFFMGEIGGNDYNFALLNKKSLQEIKDMVPDVVKAIKSAIERVISYGATRIIVPGNFPMGCFPAFLTAFQTNNDTSAYDELRCLNDLNNLIIYHNDQIKQVIEVLRKENPGIVIVYGDYYNAFLEIFRRASVLGFDEASLQKSCCGIEGNYNFNLMKTCGDREVPVCPNPNDHISWDGLHLTQNAHKFIAHWLIEDIFPKLHCLV